MRKTLLFLLLTQATFAQFDPSKITIARDEYGVPHIFAETDNEVAYGLAWVTAEDDFKTLQEEPNPAFYIHVIEKQLDQNAN